MVGVGIGSVLGRTAGPAEAISACFSVLAQINKFCCAHKSVLTHFQN